MAEKAMTVSSNNIFLCSLAEKPIPSSFRWTVNWNVPLIAKKSNNTLTKTIFLPLKKAVSNITEEKLRKLSRSHKNLFKWRHLSVERHCLCTGRLYYVRIEAEIRGETTDKITPRFVNQTWDPSLSGMQTPVVRWAQGYEVWLTLGMDPSHGYTETYGGAVRSMHQVLSEMPARALAFSKPQ